MREYPFELRLCAHLEREREAIIARQVGGAVRKGGRRILDIVAIEPGQEFERRRRITASSIPIQAIESDVGVGRAVSWSRATNARPESAARILERALEIGFFERAPAAGADAVRQTARYPDWIGSITAIENKPDLGSPGALTAQLRMDVALGLVDRVILATESYVTGAHLNRLPEEVGVWRIHAVDGGIDVEVVRSPTALEPDSWGLEVGDRGPTSWEAIPVSPAEKRRARIRLAERAYGKGWRPRFPGCEQMEVEETTGTPALPYCAWKGRVVDPAGCGPDCAGFDPDDPPDVDTAGEREARTPWVAHPPGFHREQAGIETFLSEE